MEIEAPFSSSNTIKLSNSALKELLEPIPEKALIDKIANIKGWKTKRLPLTANQSKSDYFLQQIGANISLAIFREFRIIREHSQISKFKWNAFKWDKSIARYFPDKLEKKIEGVIQNLAAMVNLDIILVDEETKTIFLLLEQWQNQIVSDTFLSKVETNIPKYFRAYMCLSKKMLLVENKSEQATKEFVKIIEQAFTVSTEKIRINAMIIRELVKNNPENLTRLVIRVPQEVAGFGGLSELTLQGSDVIIGSKGLMDRHETSPINVGPWTGVSNANISLDVGKPVKVSSVGDAILLFDLLKEML
ncbi:MAG: hypothetical protein ACTSQK_04635 [Candidatus Heimdallarchaeota archaeon]